MYFLALDEFDGERIYCTFQPHWQRRELIINSGGKSLMEFQLRNLLMWFLRGWRFK